jgi:hypothetical protein
VAEIFERYARGESIIDIVRSLNARGLKTQKGAEFNNGTLNRMFTNKSYMGVYHYNGIEIPGGVPAIVSAETFEIVQQRMAKNKRAAAKNKAKEKYAVEKQPDKEVDVSKQIKRQEALEKSEQASVSKTKKEASKEKEDKE